MGSARDIPPDHVRQLAGYGLTTAEILYHVPDEPGRLQSYVWQDYDVAPSLPRLATFLAFWRDTLDGALHSVRVAHSSLLQPVEIALAAAEHGIH